MITFERILVPLDGSGLSENALPATIELAQKFDSQIVLLRAIDMPHEVSLGWRVEAGQHARQVAESYLKSRQDELMQKELDVEISLDDASPADGILNAAANFDVDLIVMSTHGRGGLARWAVGSVADEVVRHSPCPVLLVRQDLEDTKEPQIVGMVTEAGD